MFKNEFPFWINTFQIIGFTFSIETNAVTILIRFGSEIVLCSKKRSKTLNEQKRRVCNSNGAEQRVEKRMA